MSNSSPLILALDTSDIKTAHEWIESTRDSIGVYKLGLEFFCTFGSKGVAEILAQHDVDIFLDLKLHDIPHTVAGAARAVSHLEPRFLTVHASGGGAMIASAVAAAPGIDMTAVTILTSLSDDDVKAIGYANNALLSAAQLAGVAVQAGARAIVCSPFEIEAIRKSVGDKAIIITPGVRPADSQGGDDQVRVMTPAQALSRGANFVVIGRPITSLWSQGAQALKEKAAQILAESI
ncbi:MAG: orotidine-5'-phosphate decarboxylase [Actinobacteria bacterium]|nr:orotidine-5'-phosphate decarboxylase [Actinomycetota bacterium]